ncbi:MAG: gliding-motility protein MglA [Myxococcales bacterium]|nr:gliding-motility protein MglA [Myxococcales bacterium]
MARINRNTRSLTLKIVYYGAGLSGKTTNLKHLHASYPATSRGDLLTLDTEGERTLFFDYFESSLGSLGGYRLKADFFTVPGQSFYRKTRKAVLEGADAVVFVVDASEQREDANLLSLDDLRSHLQEAGRQLESVPHVVQFNKMDLPDALPVSLMQRLYNCHDAPSFEAIASEGTGVWETQRKVLEVTVQHLKRRARMTQPKRQAS